MDAYLPVTKSFNYDVMYYKLVRKYAYSILNRGDICFLMQLRGHTKKHIISIYGKYQCIYVFDFLLGWSFVLASPIGQIKIERNEYKVSCKGWFVYLGFMWKVSCLLS